MVKWDLTTAAPSATVSRTAFHTSHILAATQLADTAPSQGAPECSRHTVQRGKMINMITTSSDIFSFGAILSHTAAWVVGGTSGQISYFRARREYHDTRVPRFKGSGYEGCFHDSYAPIPIVAQHHSIFKGKCQRSDAVTPLVIDLAEKRMLLELTRDRLRAGDALELFEQSLEPRPPSASAAIETTGTSSSQHLAPPLNPGSALATAVPSFSNAPSSTVPPSSPVQPSPPPSTASFADRVRLRDILDYRSAKRAGKPVSPTTAALVEYIEHNLAGRDQLFFIDDSANMSEHKGVIGEAFTALAYIAKRLDPDELELVFASKPRIVHTGKRATRLRQLVDRCEYRGEGSLMATRVAEFVDHVLIKRLPYKVGGFNFNPLSRKKTSVYVLTDGDWGSPTRNDACGVVAEVRRLIAEMQRRHMDRSQITLHFVRFGNKQDGKVHLQHLNEFGQTTDDSW